MGNGFVKPKGQIGEETGYFLSRPAPAIHGRCLRAAIVQPVVYLLSDVVAVVGCLFYIVPLVAAVLPGADVHHRNW